MSLRQKVVFMQGTEGLVAREHPGWDAGIPASKIDFLYYLVTVS